MVCALSCCLCCVFMCILLRNSISAVSSTMAVALWLSQVNERSSETERCICGRRSSSESERGSTDCERCKVHRPGILILKKCTLLFLPFSFSLPFFKCTFTTEHVQEHHGALLFLFLTFVFFQENTFQDLGLVSPTFLLPILKRLHVPCTSKSQKNVPSFVSY